MSIKEDINWFRQQFQEEIQAAIDDTPFSVELIIAIALQETGYLWRNIYKRETVKKTLELCVGDTISSPRRKAFPKNKLELISRPQGEDMFKIAREALESVAAHNNGFSRAAEDPDKFCHGFGIFQYDIQFFIKNPTFFLEKRWYKFEECLNICIEELNEKLFRIYGRDKSSLTYEEMVYVAIAYNKGSVNLNSGFKQGFKDSTGKFYGEYIWEYLNLAKTETNIVNRKYKVNARSGLRIRSGPGIEFDVIDILPFASSVYVGKRRGEWIEVDVEGDGVIDGFVFASYLTQI